MSVASLGYVVIESPDLAKWQKFWEGTVGLAPVEGGSARAQRYRLDDWAYRIIVEKGDRDRFAFAGWEHASEAAYEAAIARLERAGTKVTRHSDLAQERQVKALARAVDPDGNGLELFYGRSLSYAQFVSPAGVSGFVAGDMGLGHVVLPTPKIAEAKRFYMELLEFGHTDTMTFAMVPNAPPLNLYFMHADNARHHSCAIFEAPAPSGLIHMMLEAKTIDDVGRFIDRCERDKVPVTATFGRHSNDLMLSTYVLTPGGFMLEFGCDGLQIDWKNWVATTSLAPDLWGHKFMTPDAH